MKVSVAVNTEHFTDLVNFWLQLKDILRPQVSFIPLKWRHPGRATFTPVKPLPRRFSPTGQVISSHPSVPSGAGLFARTDYHPKGSGFFRGFPKSYTSLSPTGFSKRPRKPNAAPSSRPVQHHPPPSPAARLVSPLPPQPAEANSCRNTDLDQPHEIRLLPVDHRSKRSYFFPRKNQKQVTNTALFFKKKKGN